jgi:hypothetical protein
MTDATEAASARKIGVLSLVCIISLVAAATQDRSNSREAQEIRMKI